MDAQTQAWIDQENARRTATIRHHGWDIQCVIGSLCSDPDCGCADGDGPAFAYTIGLFGMGHPELLIFGLDPTTVAGVFNNLGERVRADESLLPGQVITPLEA